MLEVQALKFVRSFRKQTSLILSQQWMDDWMRDLYASFERALERGEDTIPFLQAEEEFLKARREGRITIEYKQVPVAQQDRASAS